MQRDVAKPLLVYDGDCDFCRFWIKYWQGVTIDQVDYAPFQEVASLWPEIPREKFAHSVRLIVPEGKVFGGAEAIFRMLAYVPGKGGMLWLYQNIPGAAPICEWLYRGVARHRHFSSRTIRFLWGEHFQPSSYPLAQWLFLRLLGLAYFAAFLSLRSQVTGLIGAHGILPAQSFLQAVANEVGPERYWLFPTLAWFSSSDAFLKLLTGVGAALSALVILDLSSGLVLPVLWLFYLSLVTVGRIFMFFQWDALLLEAGFLSIFFAPWRLFGPSWRNLLHLAAPSPPSTTVLWLLRWLLFRLTFMSGAVKLLSHDPTWRNLTALNFHYETQPLPTPIAWYMHQLPESFHEVSVAVVFFVELLVPFFIFAPRRLRLIACGGMCLLQILIALTGNYAFFNLLTVALCLLLLDDAFLRRFFPNFVVDRLSPARQQRRYPRFHRFTTGILAVFIVIVSSFRVGAHLTAGRYMPRAALEIIRWVAPLQLVNSYGLFAVMTTQRPEIMVEGSQDGGTWLEYKFKYKPGEVTRAPGWVAPHQPRLDWQMWFAALGNYQDNPWFVNFLVRLLEGSPQVLALLGQNPFPATPPRYIRALVYDYHFTDWRTRRSSGARWRRELRGEYFPIASVRNQ